MLFIGTGANYLIFRLRKLVHDGDFKNETIFEVPQKRNLMFALIVKEQNNESLPEEKQLLLYYNFENLQYYGFKVWGD